MSKRILFILCYISVILSQVSAATDNTMSAKLAIFAQIDSKNYAAVDAAIAQLKTTYLEDPGLAWALVHISQYLEEKGNTAKANEIRQQVIEKYSGTEQATAAKVRIIGSEIFRLLDSGDYLRADKLINQLQTVYKNNSATPWALEGIANKLQIQGYESKAVAIREEISISCKDVDLIKTVNEQLALSDRCGSKLKVIFDLIDNKQYDLAQTQTFLFMQSCRELRNFSWRLIEIADRFAKAGQTDSANVVYLEVIKDTSQPIAAGSAAVSLYRVDLLIADGKDDQIKEAIEQIKYDYKDEVARIALFFIGENYYKYGIEKVISGQEEAAGKYFEKAIAEWDAMVSQYPTAVIPKETVYYIGDCYFRLNNYVKAIDSFRKFINDNPQDEQAWRSLFMIGKTYEQMAATGQFSADEAKTQIRTAYQDLLAKYPDCPVKAYVDSMIAKNSN